jgi:hypothetical protein
MVVYRPEEGLMPKALGPEAVGIAAGVMPPPPIWGRMMRPQPRWGNSTPTVGRDRDV